MLEPLPFLEAIAYWENKVKISPKAFAALSDRAKTLAFGVARIAQGDELNTVYSMLDKAIRDGLSFEEFKLGTGDIFDRRGWSGSHAWKVDSIFRTNIQTAYNAGHYQQLVKDVDIFPYWMYSAIDDHRTRPTHAAMDNRVWPADHPVWATWFPPNGFLCRCSVIGLTEQHVRSGDITVETDDPTGQTVPILDDDGRQAGSTVLRPDKGFAVNPGEVWAESIAEYAKDKLAGYPDALRRMVLAELITDHDFALLLDGEPSSQ